MEIKASLNNLRMSPRKVRLVANLVKGMKATQAQAQLSFLVKKPAPIILKLLNSAIANAKQNFEISPDNLYISKIVVEGGASLKRWLPRAMGRATPILKRTSSVKLVLNETAPSGKKSKKSKPQVLKQEEVLPVAGQEIDEAVPEEKKEKKGPTSQKPHGSSGDAKKKTFSRQTFGNIKRVFRRKSI